MRHLCFVAILTAASLPAIVRAEEGIVLKSHPIPVGTKYKAVSGSIMTMDVDSTAGGKSFHGHSEKREAVTFSAEVLATNDVGETKIRVRFLQAEETSQEPGKDAAEKKPVPYAGKTYLVTAADGPPTVTAADGRAVSDEERKKLQSAFSDLGHRDPICAALVGRTLTPGEAISLDPSIIRQAMKVDEDYNLDVESFTLTLREVLKRKSARVAVFELAASVRGNAKGDVNMKMAIRAAGTMEYRLDNCWVVGEEMRGPLSMSGSAESGGQKILMQGLGSLLTISRVDYP